ARLLAHWLLTDSAGVQHNRRSTEEVGIE
ncbi:MAG: hypothetical protein HW381_1956, partial [Candidatus Rokubacteria bacterium]|nr:hypothetical protein [Candidatus Rokubacteria bacterium]